ncbi:MAG TPA: addiction module protein [bacterium]|nr:addiction module protein [bacterium]
MRAIDIPEISQLSTPEKILLLEDLWESIASDDSEVPVPESHKEELDRRLERHNNSPGELLSLEQLQALIERRK